STLNPQPSTRIPVTLSIVIVNWNTRDLLLGALKSIYENAPPFPFEVIVVDNASTDGSAEAVANESPNVHLIANPDNAGYANGTKSGIRSSRVHSIPSLIPFFFFRARG